MTHFFHFSWISFGIGFTAGFAVSILLFVTVGKRLAKKAAARIDRAIFVKDELTKMQNS